MAISCAVLVDWKRLTVCTKKIANPTFLGSIFSSGKKRAKYSDHLGHLHLAEATNLALETTRNSEGVSPEKNPQLGGEAEVPHQPCTRLGWECHSPPFFLLLWREIHLTSWGLVVYPIISQGFIHPNGGWEWGFWTINRWLAVSFPIGWAMLTERSAP